jgi:hypothetical protein
MVVCTERRDDSMDVVVLFYWFYDLCQSGVCWCLFYVAGRLCLCLVLIYVGDESICRTSPTNILLVALVCGSHRYTNA